MKQLLFVLVPILFGFTARAQHPLEVKLNVFNTLEGNPAFSLEYGLSKRLGVEAGIQFRKDGYEVDDSFDSTRVNYQIDYRKRQYYAELKYYFNSEKAIAGGFVGVKGFYEHFTVYKKDDAPAPIPSDARGIAFEAGYKWIFWKKMVAEFGVQISFTHDKSFNLNLTPRQRNQGQIDIMIPVKIGYRF